MKPKLARIIILRAHDDETGGPGRLLATVVVDSRASEETVRGFEDRLAESYWTERVNVPEVSS